MKKKGLVLFLLSALLFTACGTEKNKTEETDKLTVVTSFYPVYLLAQEIVQGAEGIRLENMAQPQTGCLHDYELSISDMKLLETADIFIINGGGMESFLEQALERYPELTVVDTSEGIALLEEEVHLTMMTRKKRKRMNTSRSMNMRAIPTSGFPLQGRRSRQKTLRRH